MQTKISTTEITEMHGTKNLKKMTRFINFKRVSSKLRRLLPLVFRVLPCLPWLKSPLSTSSFIGSLARCRIVVFCDSWSVRSPDRRPLAFEGMWPVVTGAATPEQASRVFNERLLNPKEFFTPHPIATVARNDPKIRAQDLAGPAWNCMTYWAARGCLRYGRRDAAQRLLEAALDATATQFERTGTIWEFYHPRTW